MVSNYGLATLSKRVLADVDGNAGISNSVDKNTNEALDAAQVNAAAQSGAAAAMSVITEALIANQLAHSINKSILSNAKTVAQQYLSIA